MQKQDSLGKLPDTPRGEFDDLLREIADEAVPERLLDLARQLQAALAERRMREDSKGNPADA